MPFLLKAKQARKHVNMRSTTKRYIAIVAIIGNDLLKS
jgi:hypothetical protein